MDRKGSIKMARVDRLDDGIPSSTLSLPINMCGPYGANNYGDEMTLYPVYSRKLVR